MKSDITELFCLVDDFAKDIEEEVKMHQLPKSKRHPTRVPGLLTVK